MEGERLFERINRLFDVGRLSEARVLIAGCGSGGGQVALQLAMSGIRRFALFDSDVLEPENVIRHVCGRRYLGQNKTDALEDVLLDRNPAIEVQKHQVDLMSAPNLDTQIAEATLVILATDNEPTRFHLNGLCVRYRVPFVVGRVFTRGIGGEVFGYHPGGACLACLESRLERTKFRTGISEIDLISENDREAIYGLDASEIKDSPGLNVDISFITAFHTRFALEAIARSLPERPKNLPPIETNYIVWGNRPVPPFEKNFQLQRIQVHQQDGCLVCSGANS